MSLPTVAFLTDFGNRDGFVGVMKGVVLSLCPPETRLIDVAHDVPPQDVRHASWVLGQAFDVFPRDTVFLVVVDPHVGEPTQKKLLLFWESLKKAVICPDNGLATRILSRYPEVRCVLLENQCFYREQTYPSTTFHGRDIYAPVAGHMARAIFADGTSHLLDALGQPCAAEDLQKLPLKRFQNVSSGCVQGEVDVVDTYGNVITNIPVDAVEEGTFRVCVNAKCVETSFQSSYTLGQNTGVVLVAGSHGCVEISVPQGNAAARMVLKPGDEVILERR